MTVINEQGAIECERIIKADRAANIDRGILPSNVVVAERLLRRGLELERAYEESWLHLHNILRALPMFFDVLLNTAAHLNPEKLREAREVQRHLMRVNEQIVQSAHALADLLRERTDLQESHGYTSEAHYHVCDVIQDASKGNGRFQQWVCEPLAHLRGRFDLKYWPELPDLIDEIAANAAQAEPSPGIR